MRTSDPFRGRPGPRCWGCGEPLPPDRFDNAHRLYHDEHCRRLHRRGLEGFNEGNPELPGRGRSPVRAPGAGDVLRVTRTADGRLAVRSEKGAARRAVREHHGTDVLPIAYYLDAGAGHAEALAFLQKSYPRTEIPG